MRLSCQDGDRASWHHTVSRFTPVSIAGNSLDPGPSLDLRELRGPGSPALDLLDGAEDHRRGALNRPSHQVPGAIAIMDLGEPLPTGTTLPSGLVVMSQ
jgi:hypothetical protein